MMLSVFGLGAAQYADIMTTIWGIRRHGLVVESNALVQQTIQNFGFMGFIGEKIVAMIIAIGLSAALFRLGFKRSAIVLLSSMTILLGIIATRNLYLLFLWQ